jgi:hypothetical protein
MSTSLTPSTVVAGLDGELPIYDPNARWCWWSMSEIYLGNMPASKKYVPKVKDYIMDPDSYSVFIVDHLDPITLIPTLREVRPANMSYTFTQTDVLFGTISDTVDTFRCYVDKSVMPYTLSVDRRLHVTGTRTEYCKLFVGSDLAGTGKVVSQVYDSGGRLIGENIKLELVALDSHTNYSIKTVPTCHTTYDLMNGEIVTAVLYDTQGNVVSKRQLMVENTTFIRSADASRKYVSHIGLESPFLSNTDDHQIDYPINVPIHALNMMGVVYYSDGSTLKLPVDGGKFSMSGLDQYISSIVGQQSELVLTYSLAPEEVAYNGNATNGKFITEPYRLSTVNPNYSYTVKLYCYPVWISPDLGYNLQWFLCNLDRNMVRDVTQYVSFSTNTGAFEPTKYGVVQKKSVSLSLKDVSAAFKPFIHTQVVDITLFGQPTMPDTPWTISHEASFTRPSYGDRLVAKKISSIGNNTVLNLKSERVTQEDWIRDVYINTYPIIDKSKETRPIPPSHMVIAYATTEVEVPISDWDKDISIGYAIPDLKTVFIKFIKKTARGDLQLSVAAMTVKP